MKTLRNSLISALCLLIAGCLAQKTPKTEQISSRKSANAPEILNDDAKLQAPRGTDALEKLAAKFNANGALAIKIFGDSHVASDDLAQGFREEFFGSNAQNSVGFAYAAMPRYQKSDFLSYKISGFEILNSQRDEFNDYPLCGVIACSQKKGASVTLQTKNLSAREYEFEILFKGVRAGEILKIEAPGFSKILTGDTARKSAKFNLKFPVKITALQAGALIEGYKILAKNARYVEHCGINGAKSDLWQKWRADAFSELAQSDYDLIALEYGTNDAMDPSLDILKFRKNMDELIKKIRQNSPNAAVLIIAPPPVIKPKFNAVKKALKEAASANGAIFYDIDAFVSANGGKRAWIEQGLSKTDVHLLPEGYKKVGKDLAEQLKNMLKSAL